MLSLLWLIPALPATSFVVLTLLNGRLGRRAVAWIGAGSVGLAAVVALLVSFSFIISPPPGNAYREVLWTWFAVDALRPQIAFYLDAMTVIFILVITVVGFLIHLYSTEFMEDEDDTYTRFFIYMNLFVASMLILVLGSNLLVTFVGWEGVGACSYWLVAFWFTRESAASAGKKAFLYNRIGDAGFLLAIFLTYDRVHSLEYQTIFANIDKIGSTGVTAICLLLLVGVMGKSAQIPLFPWLADAMEGPTPVSALIHAATMVTAGVYLLCRISPLLHASSAAALTVAVIGAATAFVAATIACAQQDIKKVLAYSTVSQLGYMFLAIGCGAYEAAIFLMVAHAFFKGLLFLGAGSVIHGLHDEQDLKRMGNLRNYLPITFITFGIGWLCIAAVPPLSGFWAKGDVLENAWAAHPALWAIGIVTAALTAYYMSRLTGLAFFGTDRWSGATSDAGNAGHGDGDGDRASEPHESSWIMTVPLWILAFFAAVAGVMAISSSRFSLAKWVDPVFGPTLYDDHLSSAAVWTLATLDAVIAVVFVLVGLRLWSTRSERPALETAFLRGAWYINELYDAVLGRPSERLAAFCADVVDPKVIDGAVNGVAGVFRGTGTLVRRTQTGYVRNYVLGIVIGTVLVLGFMLTRLWWA